jgi:cytidylate kinase
MNFILFTGYSCSGKTTIGKLLATRNNWLLVNVHYFLSKDARELGYVRARDFYVDQGNKKVTEMVAEAMLKYTNENGGYSNIVIDDIYDEYLLEEINSNFPDFSKLLISFNADYHKRLDRMSERTGLELQEEKADLALYDRFKDKSDIASIIHKSDYVLENDNINYRRFVSNCNGYYLKEEK